MELITGYFAQCSAENCWRIFFIIMIPHNCQFKRSTNIITLEFKQVLILFNELIMNDLSVVGGVVYGV